MKIITILGARPQFIKASSLSREFSKHSNVDEVIVHTGQHFDKNMSDIFFEEMEIPKPKYNLNINSLSHGAMTGRMLEEIESILIIEKPDWVVVFGDTNSTLAGALAARKMHIKVAHVEAGLRSNDMKMPEEVNRIMTDHISDVLFCPTQSAVDNLYNEGFRDKNVVIKNSGDIMYDSALYYKGKMKKPVNIDQESEFILVTIHRQENTDSREKLEAIIKLLNKLVVSGKKVVWPIHPRTKNIIEEQGITIMFDVIDPVGYLEMLYLLNHSKSVITDSGGLQKEAYFFNKFCITLRNSTEWIELVNNGYNSLIDLNSLDSIRSIDRLIDKQIDNSTELYGNGSASKNIVDQLINSSQN